MEAQAVAFENLEQPAEQYFDDARSKLAALVRRLSSTDVVQSAHSDVEVLIHDEGMAVLLALFQGHLDLRSDAEVMHPEVVGADGVARRQRRREQGRSIESVFGTVRFGRIRYQRPGSTGLAPLDGRLNLPADQYSFGTRREVALDVVKQSFEGTVLEVSRVTGAQVPKRQVQQLTRRSATDFDAFYEQRQAAAGRAEPDPTADDTKAMTVLTADAKGILVHRDDLRDETKRAVERRAAAQTTAEDEAKLYKKRMAQMASVYSVAPYVREPDDIVKSLRGAPRKVRQRPRPEHKRVWASIVKDSADVLEELFEEAFGRDPDLQTRWVAVVDGNDHQLRVLQQLAQDYGVKLTIICDIMCDRLAGVTPYDPVDVGAR